MSTDPSNNPVETVKVKIENSYADGHESETTVTVEPPEAFDEATLDDWWNNVVFPHTGDGYSESMSSSAEATVLEGPQDLVDETYGWDG